MRAVTAALPVLAVALLGGTAAPAGAVVKGGTTCGLEARPTTARVSPGQTRFVGAMTASAFIDDGSVSVTCTLLVDAELVAQGTSAGTGAVALAVPVDMAPWLDSLVELCTEVIFYDAFGTDARVSCEDVHPEQAPPQPVCDVPPGCPQRTYWYSVQPSPLA